MMKPYVNSIIMGILLSFLFTPLNDFFLKYTKRREKLSAFFTSFTLAFVVLIPLLFVVSSVVFQGIDSFKGIYSWLNSGHLDHFLNQIYSFLDNLKERYPFLGSISPDLHIKAKDIQEQVLNISSISLKWFMGQGSRIVGSLFGIGAGFFIMMIVFFVMIKDQEIIINKMLHIIPLKASQERQILSKTRELFKSVIFGNVLTALAQGIVGGIGFAIAGFPAVFWGAVIAFSSLIPVIGTALIWVPAVAWLVMSGRIGMAVFITIWFVVLVGLLDNFLRPLFIGGKDGMGPALIFFSILGGIHLWGLLGLIYGPMLFGIWFVVIYLYQLEFSAYLDFQDKN